MKFDFLFISIILGILITNINSSIISPFFSDFCETSPYFLQETIVGAIFASLPVGVFIASLVISKFMNREGIKKPFLLIGIVI